MGFDGWLDARDGETVAREWQTLGAKRVEIGRRQPLPPRIERMLGIKPDAAALLAAAFLGVSPERFAWFMDDQVGAKKPPPPTYEIRRDVPECTIDAVVACTRECTEAWQIREAIEGARGVQHIRIEYFYGEQTRDGSGGGGGSVTVVRLFERSTSRGVSVRLHGDEAWTIGEPIDLAPLDLFGDRTEFKLAWKTYDPDSLLALFARLAAGLDAHFETCTSWPGGVVEDRVIDDREYDIRVRKRVYRWESGPYAISLDELLDPDGKEETGWLTAKVHGLPWGHDVSARIDQTDDPAFGVSGWLDLRLPRVQLEATLARLAAVPNVTITY